LRAAECSRTRQQNPRRTVDKTGRKDWEVFERNDHAGGPALNYIDEHDGDVMSSHHSCVDSLVEKTPRGDYDHA
jgi:hypothetical protein